MDYGKLLALLNLAAFLTIIATAFFFAACFMITLGKPPIWVVRIANNGILFSSKREDAAKSLNKKFKYKLFPFRYSVIWSFIVAIAVGCFIIPEILVSDKPLYLTNQLVIACFVVGYIFLGLAGRLHLKENSRRKNKYELIISGMIMLYIGYAVLAEMTPKLIAQWRGQDAEDILVDFASEFAGRLLAPALWMVIVAVIASLLIRPRRRRGSSELKKPGRIIRFLYKFRAVLNPSTWLAIILFAAAISELLLARTYASLIVIFIPLRYFAVERMLDQPVIYLRSFSYAEAPVVLGKIVMPALRFLAPVLAISHELQAADKIYRKTDPTEKIHLTRLPDKEWREHISRQLPHSTATIIDYTVQSGGVAWELEEALKVVPRNRIIVIQSQGAEPPPVSGIKIITYTLDWKSQRKAKKELRQYLKSVLVGSHQMQPAQVG